VSKHVKLTGDNKQRRTKQRNCQIDLGEAVSDFLC
jgi:hypothetical protein